MLSAAQAAAELAALALFIATILLWAAIIEKCATSGNAVAACVFG